MHSNQTPPVPLQTPAHLALTESKLPEHVSCCVSCCPRPQHPGWRSALRSVSGCACRVTVDQRATRREVYEVEEHGLKGGKRLGERERSPPSRPGRPPPDPALCHAILVPVRSGPWGESAERGRELCSRKRIRWNERVVSVVFYLLTVCALTSKTNKDRRSEKEDEKDAVSPRPSLWGSARPRGGIRRRSRTQAAADQWWQGLLCSSLNPLLFHHPLFPTFIHFLLI